MSAETTPAAPRIPPHRRRRWPRVLLVLAATLLALLLLVAGLAYYALNTQGGLRVALAPAQRFTNGALQVGSADGRVLGELDLRDVRYHGADGTVVTIAHVHLRYQPRSLLLGRRFHVEVFDVDTLDLTPGTGAPPVEPRPATNLPVRLPVGVIVDSLNLSAFTLHSSANPAQSVLVIGRAEFAGQWLGDTIEVHRLATALPQTGALQAQAKLRMASDHIDVENLLLQGAGEISAKGTVGIGAAQSRMAFEVHRLHWPLVLPDDQTPAQVGNIEARLKLNGTTVHYEFDLEGQASLQGRAAKLAANGSGSLTEATIARLQLDTLPGDGSAAANNARSAGKSVGNGTGKSAGGGGSISASGHVAWAPQIQAEIKALLSHVDPAVFAPGMSGDINGRLDVDTKITAGQRPDIGFTADLSHSTLRGQPFSLKAEGSTDTERARLKDLLLLAGEGRVQAKGEVAWTPRLAANIEAQIARLNPALAAADWPGEINGSVRVRTANEARAPIVFEAQIGDSKLRGYPLRLDANGEVVDGRTVVLRNLDLRSGATRLTASGQVTPPFAASGKLESPDLASLYPKLAGRAAFDFKLAGTIEQPHLITHGEAGALAFGEQTVRSLSWDADVDPKVDSKISVKIADAQVGVLVSRLELRASGLEVYHRVELDAATERGTANLALQGGYDRVRNEWGGELAALGFTPQGQAAWSLAKGAGILVGARRRALEPACLQSAEGRACFNLEQNVLANGTRIGWNIERLLLHAFQPLLPPENLISGSLDGEGSVNFTGGELVDAVAALNLHDARLEVPDAPPLLLTTGSLRADQREGRLHGVVELRTEQGAVNADLAAAPGTVFNERALSGKVTMNFPNLAFLEPLLPQLRSLAGRLDGSFDLSGTPQRPRFAGQVLLADGHARLVAAGIEVKDLQLKVSGNGDGPMALDGRLSSGDGSLNLSGRIDPFAKPLFADIAVKGDNFQALNTAQARAWVSPDLHLVRDAKGATLTGELTVPHADITPKGFGGGGIEASSDQILIGAEAPPPEAALPVYADLRLVLGDAVRIEGFGLKTRIEGAVSVTQEPRRGALGRGELRLVDGHYKAYGQDLNIETGRLLFTGGPVTTPAVDLYATRKPREDITVGVRVRGTLAKPELTLQSSPSLPREQQLSWLILGRSLETSSSQDRSLVSSAALSLGLGGGDYLAGLIGKRVGLDQLSVGGAAGNASEVAANAQSIAGAQTGSGAVDAGAQAAQLTLGKYLTPRLFVSYGISLFQQGYTIRLLYTLGRGFKLSTESGTASGGDVIYQTERGKRNKPPPGAAPSTTAEPAADTPLKIPGAAPAIEPKAETRPSAEKPPG